MECRKCIFCGEERTQDELSVEHIFPQAIGGCLTINAVCRPCNNFLGTEVDKHLTDHWRTRARRHALGFMGKRGKEPAPFDRGILQNEDEPEVSLTFSRTGPMDVSVLPGKTVVSREDLDVVRFRIDARNKDKLPDMVNKFLRRNKLPEKSSKEILDNAKRVQVDDPWIAVDTEIDMRMYKRAVLKIVYELTWRWLGDEFLHDPIADMIRRSIIENSFEYPVRGNIRIIGDEGPLIPLWNQNPMLHIGALSNIAGSLLCYVRIFSDFDGGVVVSETPEVYPDFHSGFLAVDPVNRTIVRESTLEEEIAASFA